ncbi:MAG: hypothetical protein RBT46_01370 [Weeksellaceae bacterium]|jgi:hypothetical protein|nr:hypothetical protein [Weeksellaceae bacterium]MDX9704343.1 hypothetical protein [Weeksellaceae bacterium]
MRFNLILGIALLGIISCEMKPNVPIALPQDFNKKEYVAELKKEKIKSSQPEVSQEKVRIQPEIQSETKRIPEKTDSVLLKIVYGKAKSDSVLLAHQKTVFRFDTDTARKLNLKISSIDSSDFAQIKIINPEGKEMKFQELKIEYPIETRGIHNVEIMKNLKNNSEKLTKYIFEVQLIW